MRIVAVLLAVMFAVPAALAVKPAKPGPSLEETLKFINERLATSDESSTSAKCRDTARISFSESRDELIVRDLLVDRHGKVIEDTPPKYVYRIPVASVSRIYLWGPWTTHDRLIVRTRGRVVIKTGPVWDCNHRRLSNSPREKLQDSIHLKVQDPNDESLDSIGKALHHAIQLLLSEQDSKTGPPEVGADDPDK